MGELAQVIEIDKRIIKNEGDLLNKLNNLFREKTIKSGTKIL